MAESENPVGNRQAIAKYLPALVRRWVNATFRIILFILVATIAASYFVDKEPRWIVSIVAISSTILLAFVISQSAARSSEIHEIYIYTDEEYRADPLAVTAILFGVPFFIWLRQIFPSAPINLLRMAAIVFLAIPLLWSPLIPRHKKNIATFFQKLSSPFWISGVIILFGSNLIPYVPGTGYLVNIIPMSLINIYIDARIMIGITAALILVILSIPGTLDRMRARDMPVIYRPTSSSKEDIISKQLELTKDLTFTQKFIVFYKRGLDAGKALGGVFLFSAKWLRYWLTKGWSLLRDACRYAAISFWNNLLDLIGREQLWVNVTICSILIANVLVANYIPKIPFLLRDIYISSHHDAQMLVWSVVGFGWVMVVGSGISKLCCRNGELFWAGVFPIVFVLVPAVWFASLAGHVFYWAMDQNGASSLVNGHYFLIGVPLAGGLLFLGDTAIGAGKWRSRKRIVSTIGIVGILLLGAFWLSWEFVDPYIQESDIDVRMDQTTTLSTPQANVTAGQNGVAPSPSVKNADAVGKLNRQAKGPEFSVPVSSDWIAGTWTYEGDCNNSYVTIKITGNQLRYYDSMDGNFPVETIVESSAGYIKTDSGIYRDKGNRALIYTDRDTGTPNRFVRCRK